MQNLDKKDSHLVITLHSTYLEFRHSDGRSGTQLTPNGKERLDVINYVITFFYANTVELNLA
jgi:hypothetical protein